MIPHFSIHASLGVALLVAVPGCSGSAERDAALDTAAEAREAAAASEAALRASFGREWELARLGNTALPPSVTRDPRIPPGDPHPGVRPTIRFADDAPGASGRSFCNGYGGPFVLRGDSLRISEIESSAVGCDGPDSLETRFFRALRDTRRFAFAGDTLALLAPDGSRLLLFVPLGATRTAAQPALGAARGVTSAAEPDERSFRVVPLRPLRGDVEILSGHPDSAGRAFVMRIRELPGTVVPPHTHPVDEHITVVSGTWYFGTGERFDSSALRELRVGAYAFAPAGTSMFAYSPDGAVVQVHGVGPFHIHWRDPARMLDNPADTSAFRFRKGDAVVTRRGAGRIRQGYSSGALIQYEVDGADGSLYMAHEHEIRVR